MKVGRSTRIFGMMNLFGLLTAVLSGHWKYAGPATLAAVITGGFAGELWHRWREGQGATRGTAWKG